MRCSFSIKIRKGVPFLAPSNPRFSPSEAPAKPPAWIPALDKMPGHRTPPPQASPRPAKMPRSRANFWIISSSYALLFIPDKSGSKPVRPYGEGQGQGQGRRRRAPCTRHATACKDKLIATVAEPRASPRRFRSCRYPAAVSETLPRFPHRER